MHDREEHAWAPIPATLAINERTNTKIPGIRAEKLIRKSARNERPE